MLTDVYAPKTIRISDSCEISSQGGDYKKYAVFGMWLRVVWYMGTDTVGEPTASIFRVKGFCFPENGGRVFLRNFPE
jgi:hypothetical protein